MNNNNHHFPNHLYVFITLKHFCGIHAQAKILETQPKKHKLLRDCRLHTN